MYFVHLSHTAFSSFLVIALPQLYQAAMFTETSGKQDVKSKGKLEENISISVPPAVQLVCHFPFLNFNFRYFKMILQLQ